MNRSQVTEQENKNWKDASERHAKLVQRFGEVEVYRHPTWGPHIERLEEKYHQLKPKWR